jgi:hypothetical protein
MTNALRKFVYAGAILALWAQAASAQVGITPEGMKFSPFKQGDKPPPTPEEIERQKAIDEAYKAASKKIPDKKVNDPWATVRPTQNSAASKQ